MLVQEMHIAVKEGIRNSPRKIELDSPRIDFHLNYVQDSFITSRVRPKISRQGLMEGFEIDQKNLGDLRTVIVKNKKVPLYKTEATDYYWDQDLFIGFTPPRLMYLIGLKIDSFYQTSCQTLTYEDSPVSVYAKSISFDDSIGTSDFYQAFSFALSIPGKTLTDYVNSDPGILSAKDKFLLVDNVIEHYRTQGVDIYWEGWGEFYKPDCFIIANVTNDFTVAFSYRIDDQTNYTSTITDLFTGGYRNYLVPTFSTTTHTKVLGSPSRVIESEYLHKVLKENEYTRSHIKSPVSTMFSDFIGVYGRETFAPTDAAADYIRKPRAISLTYNRSCELPEHTHDDIVDLAIKNILRSSESSFQIQSTDMQLNN